MTETTTIDIPADHVKIAALMTAQIAGLLADLRRQRAEMTAQVAGLQGRSSSGHAQIDRIRADLSAQISRSLTAVDALIEEAETAARQLGRSPAAA